MNRTETIRKLAAWIESLKEAARKDIWFSVSWFKETENAPFSIIGGWDCCFSENQTDILCCSKSDPSYAMSVKIITNNDTELYPEFEFYNMPTNKSGEVDDTCIALEWRDSAERAAEFFYGEWERIMKEHENK